MSSYIERMIGAARLDAATYEEVEQDRNATWQAIGVIVLSSLAAGIGIGAGEAGPGLVISTAAALVTWLIWAMLTWVIGTKLLPGLRTDADFGQLLRGIGFAAAPGILRIGGFVPAVGPLIALAAFVWMLAAVVVAVRQALDYTSTWRALAVAGIGWITMVVLLGLVLALFGVDGRA